MKSIKKIIESQPNFTMGNIIKKVNIEWDVHAKLVFQIAKALEPNYIIDDNNKEIFKQLLLYFTGNDDFNGSLKKGIMLVGDTGTGKSLIFRIFKQYTMHVLRKNSFQLHTCIDIIDNVNVSGISYLDIFSHNKQGNKPYPITCYIDDIASKNEKVKHYGTDINVIEQLLSLRYNVFEKYNKLTHVTTNLFPKQLKNVYDDRITSRMSEMFNVIELKGKDYRKIF